MMTVISSQRYIDYEIVEEKIEMLAESGAEAIEVPVIRSYLTDDCGNELFIMVDKHHTLSAAREMGIEINFVEVEDEISYCKDIEDHNGEAIAEAHYMDSNWYYINNEDTDMIGVDVW